MFVAIAHTGASDIAQYTKQADIVVAAIGRADAITGAMLKPGCVVIDVGMNREMPACRRACRQAGTGRLRRRMGTRLLETWTMPQQLALPAQSRPFLAALDL